MRIFELYQEQGSSSFTHDGQEYDLNALLKLTDDAEVHHIPVDELTWIEDHDQPDGPTARVTKADLTAPVLVTWWFDENAQDHKLVVLDGLHRLTKADTEGLEYILGIYVENDQLEKCAAMFTLSKTQH